MCFRDFASLMKLHDKKYLDKTWQPTIVGLELVGKNVFVIFQRRPLYTEGRYEQENTTTVFVELV